MTKEVLLVLAASFVGTMIARWITDRVRPSCTHVVNITVDDADANHINAAVESALRRIRQVSR